MSTSHESPQKQSFAWIGWVLLIILVGWQSYLGVTIQEVGIPGVFSVKFGNRPPPPARMSMTEPDIDRYGSDYKDFVSGTIEDCLRECTSDPRCKAISFNTASNQCWMKTSVALRRDHKGFISAVKIGD